MMILLEDNAVSLSYLLIFWVINILEIDLDHYDVYDYHNIIMDRVKVKLFLSKISKEREYANNHIDKRI